MQRRTFLTSAAAVAGGSLLVPRANAAPAFHRTRLTLPSGVQTGDVTIMESGASAVLWARSSGPGRLVARVGRHVIRGPRTDARSDFTARIPLHGLPAGCELAADLWFEDDRGVRGEVQTARLRTPSRRNTEVSFVWTGDCVGQGWGINPDVGGMTTFRTMHETRPDFFLHSGDTIYADGPLAETVVEPDGQVWRNVVTPEVAKVAETLAEYRGRHAYNRLDANVRALYADVPMIAQWDDHETHNNWYPGQILDDDRYTEKRVDVLARFGRQAWQEYQPIDTSHVQGRGRTGFAEARIYRKIARGPHLDVFCLDMRSFKDPNTAGTEPSLRHILGDEQTEWLIREVSRSRATWKVIANDLPLGIVVPDGKNQESLSNADPGRPLGKEFELARVLRAFKRNRVRNVVWLTADVHYAAANHYNPARAAFTDFDPFWEFVAGPVNAGTGPKPNPLDATFGPRQVFAKAADTPNESPRAGNQFFGHVAIDRHGRLTVSLRNTAAKTLFTKTLEPEHF